MLINKNLIIITITIIKFLSFESAEGSNILFYFGQSTHSHRVAVWPLVEALAERGHNVTFFSTLIPMNKNPKVIEFTPKFRSTFNYNLTSESMLELRISGTQSKVWDSLPNWSNVICEFTLKDPEVREWIKRSKFDLVVIGAFFNECGLGMAYRWQAKWVLFSPTSFLMWYGDEFGHSPESSWIPELDLQLPREMNFIQRVYNTIRPLYWQFWVRRFHYLPEAERIIRSNLDVPDMPDLAKLWRNTSLVLLNTHHSFEFARSLPPLYVSVGGMHVQHTSSVLSKELNDFIDGSGENGFIYFSFGSLAKPSTLPSELLQLFYDVFDQFKNRTRFVWTFDMERPKEMPDNVYTIKWAPQHALLGHPKIKGFITQAGAMSVQEAIYFKVPAILFPLFGDQDNNADSLERKGCGIKLEIRGLQRETLRNAISAILNDNRYKSRMKKLSEIYEDRERSPLETAVWWTEYVLRHDDTSFLKPLAMNQTWYEIRLLDVWIFVLSLTLLLFLGLIYLARLCFLILKTRTSRFSQKIKKS